MLRGAVKAAVFAPALPEHWPLPVRRLHIIPGCHAAQSNLERRCMTGVFDRIDSWPEEESANFP